MTIQPSLVAAEAAPPKSEPLAYTINELVERGPFSRGFLYGEIRAERLVVHKAGSKTIITPENFRAWMAALPQGTAPERPYLKEARRKANPGQATA